MNRDARELFKLYEQTVSVGNIQLQQPQPSVSIGNTQLQGNNPYNLQVPQVTPAYGPAGVTPPQNFDYEAAKKDWREFQEKNFLLAALIQILDPTSITSIPDIEDAYVGWSKEKTSPFRIFWLVFNIFCAIPLWVPVGGEVAKVFNFLKGGKAAVNVATKVVKPKTVVASLDLVFQGLKNPKMQEFLIGVLKKINLDQKAIDEVIRAINASDPAQLVKIGAERFGIKGDEFTKALEVAQKESEEATRLASKGSISAAKDVAFKMMGDPLIVDTTKDGLIAKVKYWLGKEDPTAAIEYLKKGDFKDLPENIKPLLTDIAKKYGIKESQLVDYFKLVWPDDIAIAAVTKTAAKAAGEAAEAAAPVAARAGASGVREIDKIAKEFENTVDILNRSDLPKSMQSMVERIKAKGGITLASALKKINVRNSAEAIAKVGGDASVALTRAERQALEKAAKALEEGGILRSIANTAGRLTVKGAKVVAFKAFLGLKVAAALQYWLKRQYEKGKAYKPTEPKKIQVTGLPGGYIPQGATVANPQGRNAPNAQTIYPPTPTSNQYQYKPVKWWSTQ